MTWLNKILQVHWKWCVNIFRMDAATLQSISFDFETQCRLKALKIMSVSEKVAIFLYALTWDASNREV